MYLKALPLEITKEQHIKGIAVSAGEMTDVARPTLHGAEFAALVLRMIGQMAHERDTREVVAAKCAPWVLACLRVVIEERDCNTFGLRCLYNFVYLSPNGWRTVSRELEAGLAVQTIKTGPLNGDEDVRYEVRRCELALAPDGWQGKVMAQLEEEVKKERWSPVCYVYVVYVVYVELTLSIMTYFLYPALSLPV